MYGELKLTEMNLIICLLANGINYKEIIRTDPKKLIFVFDESKRVEELINLYFNKRLTLEVTNLFSTQKFLKSIIYNN